ncbi:MAG TPA: S-layer homology domain-containing protein [Thermoanaerobaculia bacterium]|nr:S-layer homology domain-containing protein [Thermoanaerobaculia bacterium]
MRTRRASLAALLCLSAFLGGAAEGLLGLCGPFTDVAADVFCPFVLEIFYLGITTGTTATTYDPTANVTRLQMAAFLSRTVDGVLKRGSRRAILDQFWTAQNATVLGVTTIGAGPRNLRSDGADVWVANFTDNTVSRVRGSDGKLLETWTGATGASRVLVAMGAVFVTGELAPGRLYRIDPTQAAGGVTAVATNIGDGPLGVAFDGGRIWTANRTGGSVSIVTPGASIPWTVTTTATGFGAPYGATFDGTNVWVTDINAGKLLKLDSAGAISLTVGVGASPATPVFDGNNIWVPNGGAATISVVRASTGTVLTTLTGNGLGTPETATFDGQRVLVTNYGLDSVSFWKAADLTPLGSVPTGAGTPYGACSDGPNFWVALNLTGKLVKF